MREQLDALIYGELVPPAEVVGHYYRLSPGGPKDLEALVSELPVWTVEQLTPSHVARGIFYYAPDIPAGHPDHLFTDHGRDRTMIGAARNFLKYDPEYDDPASPLFHHWYLRNIRYFRDRLRDGQELPHAIAVTGRIQRDLWFIDGNTRTLSATSVWLEDGGTFPRLSAYVGRKSFLQL